MDIGACRATVHGDVKSQTRSKLYATIYNYEMWPQEFLSLMLICPHHTVIHQNYYLSFPLSLWLLPLQSRRADLTCDSMYSPVKIFR